MLNSTPTRLTLRGDFAHAARDAVCTPTILYGATVGSSERPPVAPEPEGYMYQKAHVHMLARCVACSIGASFATAEACDAHQGRAQVAVGERRQAKE